MHSLSLCAGQPALTDADEKIAGENSFPLVMSTGAEGDADPVAIT